MLNRVIKSSIFGVMMTLVMLISHKMKPVSALPIWLEAIIRFLISAVVYFLVILTIDFIRSKKQEDGKHEA